MRVIKAGYERITEKDPIKKIEQVARVCYKSEDKICEGSAVKMVRGLVRSKHYAMLEHGSVAIALSKQDYNFMLSTILEMNMAGINTYLRYTALNSHIISGNLRAWREFIENCVDYHRAVIKGVVKILFKYSPVFDDICGLAMIEGTMAPMEIPVEIKDFGSITLLERMVHEDVSVKWICDRGVSHEIVRHRPASYAQESTRYCNYGKAGEVTFIDPSYMWRCMDADTTKYLTHYWQISMEQAERAYMMMLDKKATPQMARSVLPNSVKTEVVMTANLEEWVHFFDLRALGLTGKPHPQMEEIAKPFMEEILKEYPFLEMHLGGCYE